MADTRYVEAGYSSTNYTVYTADATFTQDPYVEGESYIAAEYVLDKRKLTATLTVTAEDLDFASASITSTATMSCRANYTCSPTYVLEAQPFDTEWQNKGTWQSPRQEIWSHRVFPYANMTASPVVPSFDAVAGFTADGDRKADIIDFTITDFATISARGNYLLAGGTTTKASQATIQTTPNNVIRAVDIPTYDVVTGFSSRGTYQIKGSATLNNNLLIETPPTYKLSRALNEVFANNLNLDFTGTRLRRHEKTLNAEVTITRKSATTNRDVQAGVHPSVASISIQGSRFPGPHLLELRAEAQIPFNNGGYLIEFDKSLSSAFSIVGRGREYVIDPYRIYVVDAETRLLAVEQEDRQIQVDSETRLNTIPQETRGLTIKSETRTLEVQNLVYIDVPGPYDRRE